MTIIEGVLYDIESGKLKLNKFTGVNSDKAQFKELVARTVLPAAILAGNAVVIEKLLDYLNVPGADLSLVERIAIYQLLENT